MKNSWWEINIQCDPVLEDLVFWRLENFGCSGMASETKKSSYRIRGYSPEVDVQSLDLAALSLLLRQDALELELPAPETQWKLIDEEDWASSWKEHWQPQEIGDRILIYPAWLTPPENPERLIVRLDPGAAFGTGVHPTTQLCIEALEMRLGDASASNKVIADIGCGSGILSLSALKMGAKKAYAVDVDSMAIRATYHNRSLNDISGEQLVAEKGSLDKMQRMIPEPVDGIVCNILAHIIQELIPEMSSIAHHKTWAIFSGILLEQAGEIADTLEKHNWIIATLWKRKEWCCFNVRRS